MVRIDWLSYFYSLSDCFFKTSCLYSIVYLVFIKSSLDFFKVWYRFRISDIYGYWSLYVVLTFSKYSSYFRKWPTLFWYLFWFLVNSSISLSKSKFSSYYYFLFALPSQEMLFLRTSLSIMLSSSSFHFPEKTDRIWSFLVGILYPSVLFFLILLEIQFPALLRIWIHSKLLFFSFEGFMNFVHFSSLLQQLSRWWYCFILIEDWNLCLFFHTKYNLCIFY